MRLCILRPVDLLDHRDDIPRNMDLVEKRVQDQIWIDVVEIIKIDQFGIDRRRVSHHGAVRMIHELQIDVAKIDRPKERVVVLLNEF